MKGICRIYLAGFGFWLVVLAGCANTCPSSRVRSFDAEGPHRFHRPVTLQVGWQSYRDQDVSLESDSTVGVFNSTGAVLDSVATGVIPVLVLHYPDDASRITLPMGIDDALLGRLIKSTAMTEMPVKEPLVRYLERADCAHCHPAAIPLE